MSAKPSFFQIGLFVIIALAILVGALIAFGAGQIFRPRTYIETYVDGTVQGIEVGSPVKFRGVQIGRVNSIDFSFNEYGTADKVDRYNYVIILMEIDREMFPGMFSENLTPLIKKSVEQGLRARIEPLGITGMNYIEINYVKDPTQFPPLAIDWVPHYYYIPSAPGQLTNILDSVNNIMREVEKLNISGMTASLNELLDNLNRAVTGADLGKVSADLQQLLEELRSSLTDANLGAVSEGMQSLMTGLEKTNTELSKVLTNIEPSTRLNSAEIRSIVRNLAEATANIETLSAEVKKRPSLLLWGTPPSEKKKPTPRPTPAPRR
jgi:ABC-type transporter Mla subunit MlaD